MDKEALLRLILDREDWVPDLAAALAAAVGPGPKMGRLRALYGISMEISLAIGKEMLKITHEGEPLPKRRVALMTGDNGGGKKGGQ